MIPRTPGSRPRAPSWADDLSALLVAMRDVHGGLIELEAREARLFELVERVTRRLLDEHAEGIATIGDERDAPTPELLAEKLPGDRRIKA